MHICQVQKYILDDDGDDDADYDDDYDDGDDDNNDCHYHYD